MDRSSTKWVRFCVILLGFLVAFPLFAHADVTTGLSWLAQQQQTDGSFYTQSTTSTPIQATGEALLTLDAQNAISNAASSQAMAFLNAQSGLNTEDTTRLLRINDQLGNDTSAALTSVWSNVNPSAGLGDYPGEDSAVLATADALRALTAAKAPVTPAANQALAWLLGLQSVDGGWALAPNASSVYTTAQVLAALEPLRFQFDLSANVSNGVTYLFQQQSSTGWDSSIDTALALLVIIPVTVDSSQYQAGLTALQTTQLADGSWNDDVFATALALQALQLAKSQPVVTPPTDGSAAGQVLNASSNQPLSGVTIKAGNGVLLITATSTADGHFTLPALSPGTYGLTYTAAGFSSASQSVSVQAGQQVNLGVVQLSPLPDTALINGQVRDASTGQPLVATVTISGASSTTVTTGADGSYTQVIALGAVTVTVSATGYHSVTATAAVTAGEHLAFSPSLYPDAVTPPTTSQVTGQVLDANTHAALLGVTVAVTGTSLQTTTDMLGNFTLQGIPPGNATLTVTQTGYQTLTLSMTSSQGAALNAGTLYLQPVPVISSTIEGTVTDQQTGAPLPGATVRVGSLTVQTDVNGQYQVSLLTGLDFTVTASATGYLSETDTIQLTQPTTVTDNIALQQVAVNGVKISGVATDKPSYPAYAAAQVSGTLANNGSATLSVSLAATVTDATGKVVDTFPVSLGPTEANGFVNLTPGQTLPVSFQWFTRNLPPGPYQIVVQAVSYITQQVLSESSVSVQVESTSQLNMLRVFADPSQQIEGASTTTVTLYAGTENGSNVSVSPAFHVVVNDPDGNVIYQQDVTYTLDDSSVSATQKLGSFTYAFAKPGVYPIVISNLSGPSVGAASAGNINVLPNLHIQPSASLQPNQIVPGADATVHVGLSIQGTGGNP